MAVTPSTMLPLGSEAPDFALEDVVTGERVRRADFEDQPLLVMFLCNHCPYVRHILSGLTDFADDYADDELGIVAINSNDVEHYPQDGPDRMRELAEDQGWEFPFLLDTTQEVAKAYGAACTPDFFLFDEDHELVYRGQFDDSRPRNDLPVTGDDLRDAVDALLDGEEPDRDQKPSVGCNIKWAPGNAPGYFG